MIQYHVFLYILHLIHKVTENMDFLFEVQLLQELEFDINFNKSVLSIFN